MSESYKVVRRFRDQDGRVYEIGDVYPADGLRTTKKRIKQLSTTNNQYGQVYIESGE
ncbi:hypothetical protein [Paenibacillus senegalensis]|uniref:hypothetical protein n=1 Tax=Paenibacillus senegalensis TaxID=1465766 RepID=UPI000289F9A3|nr:hypothetical protein [Paenibacillus senegalensis]